MMGDRRTKTLVVLALAGAALLVTPGAFGQSLDGKIDALRNQIASEKQKEGVLSSQIDSAGDGIEALEGDIGSLSTEVSGLERELASHRSRLAGLRTRYATQTRHLGRLERDHDIAQKILEQRLVELYETGQTGTLEILLGVTSLGELVEEIDFANDIGRHDRSVAETLRRLEAEMRQARKETAAIKAEVAAQTAAIAEKTAAAQAARDALVARQNALAAALGEKRELLSSVKAEREDAEEDLDAMLAASAQLAGQIQSGGSSGNGSPSAQGFIWPVAGPVTSGFGMRWGRMHEGIDIGAPTGTAIHAAAAGTVIYAGVMGGYGNIVVIDHGEGVSTAYGHMSAIWIGGGSVAQGASIGAVGCTGHCFGPHLHFEVRINGSPVDPLGYL
jgi:murein DD-endopeptidase MepM/ murein hydrolase activator NlpD